ncbi:hypothetical protein L1887_54021 [Cichorium endivia]|nr:hypothetical protein L1887_54021 [Cichorium endivia]
MTARRRDVESWCTSSAKSARKPHLVGTAPAETSTLLPPGTVCSNVRLERSRRLEGGMLERQSTSKLGLTEQRLPVSTALLRAAAAITAEAKLGIDRGSHLSGGGAASLGREEPVFPKATHVSHAHFALARRWKVRLTLNPHGSERQHYSISPPKLKRKSAKRARRICRARLYLRRALEESAEQSNKGAKEKVRELAREPVGKRASVSLSPQSLDGCIAVGDNRRHGRSRVHNRHYGNEEGKESEAKDLHDTERSECDDEKKDNANCSGTFGKPTQPEKLRADDGMKSVGLRDIAHRKHDWSRYEERKLKAYCIHACEVSVRSTETAGSVSVCVSS